MGYRPEDLIYGEAVQTQLYLSEPDRHVKVSLMVPEDAVRGEEVYLHRITAEADRSGLEAGQTYALRFSTLRSTYEGTCLNESGTSCLAEQQVTLPVCP